MAVLWWSWTGYAWLGNVVRADEGVVREVMLAAMATMFIFALAIPEAFDDLPGGLYGPVVVPICYLVFRLLHLTMFWVASRRDPVLRRQVMRFAPSVLAATLILLVAGQPAGPRPSCGRSLSPPTTSGPSARWASGWRCRLRVTSPSGTG